MKKLSLGIAVAGALGFMAGPVSAADIHVKAPPPVVMPALYNWSGIYIGVEGGAIMGQNSDWIAEPDAFNHFCSGSVWGGACQNVGHPMHGGFVGGEAGFNWQPVGSRWVFGIEGDGQWAELEEALTCAVPLNTSDGLHSEFSCGSRIHDFESVRGRIGYAFGPRGDFLVYVTGGWLTANQSVLVKTLFTPFASEEQSHRINGFQVGGGAEYGITPWLSLKGEILYSWLESHTFCSPATNTNLQDHISVTPCGPLVNESVKIHDDFVLARMGLNWRFWWGKGTPVVASY